ncbi:MAG: hypothetical protein KBT03_10810 [Bacteroidales bacterium]|nr:hypothetical protein [Candidatus Scybalousia scybalohippi]
MKVGRQEPTFCKVGDYAYSDGEIVAEMFEDEGGATFYPAQLNELVWMLARKEDGSPAAQTIGISKPRQNGKSYAARYYAIYMADFEHRSVMYSAHHSSTTKKMFDAICSIFENKERFPDFASDVKRITRGRGYEGIYFNDWKDEDGKYHEGGCIEFSTRTNAGARGGTYSVIIIDEAQEMTADQQEGMLPVISAASNAQDKTKLPQQIYIGTPPAPSCNGTVFRKMHDTAHENEDSEIWWLEWSINSLEEIRDIGAVSLAYETNPAMGYRIAEETIINEYEQMQIDGFARERLGWWTPISNVTIDYAIDKEAWKKCESNQQKPEGKTAYGIKFSADGSQVSLSGAVISDDGKIRISLISHESTAKGVRWLSDWLNQRADKACCVVIDGRNGVDVICERIADVWKYKNSVIRPTTKDMIAAASSMVAEINEGNLTWYKMQEDLNDSALNATKRPIAGGWGFGGDNSTPIEACSLALWGVKNSKRNPSKKMRIG